MSYNENFMFFNEGTDAANATGDGQMFKSSSFLGADVTGPVRLLYLLRLEMELQLMILWLLRKRQQM